MIAAPTDRFELTMLAIATLLTSAAWLVARFVRVGSATGGRGVSRHLAT